MIKNNTLHYLQMDAKMLSDDMNTLVDECIEEVKTLSKPAFIHQRFSLSHNPLKINELNMELPYSDLADLLVGCDECIIEAITLGSEIDRRIRYYSFSDMSRMSVFDAAASSYVEYVCDEFEKALKLRKTTIRFCPGYGNVPISLNRELASILHSDKYIGLFVQESDLLLPQKSMIAIMGIGIERKEKDCFTCIKKQSCELRKRGKRCYLND